MAGGVRDSFVEFKISANAGKGIHKTFFIRYREFSSTGSVNLKSYLEINIYVED